MQQGRDVRGVSRQGPGRPTWGAGGRSRGWAAMLAAGLIASLTVVAVAAPAQAAPAHFQMPVACGETWIATTYSGHTANAIDLNRASGDYGAPVLASAAGTVQRKSDPSGYGNYVDVVHAGGWVTRYAHLSNYGAASGAAVSAGAVIGYVGSTGNSTGDHLHYEQRLNNVAQHVTFNGQSIAYTTTWGTAQYTSQNCGPSGNPAGSFDSAASPEPGKVRVVGWMFDPGAPTQALEVHLYIGAPAGQAGAESHNLDYANLSRPDVGAVYPGVGDNHGFNRTVTTAKRGSQPVYVYAINAPGTPGENVLLGTRTVTIAAPTAPGAPVMGAAVGESASAVVSWTAPTSTGGSPVTGYVVTPYLAGVAQPAVTFASTVTTQTVTGLQNGTSYRFRVAAVNAIGTGPQSPESNAATPSPLVLSTGGAGVSEGNSGTVEVRVPITMSRTSSQPVSVDYTTLVLEGTGLSTAGVDFVPVSGTLTIASGQTQGYVSVTVMGDEVAEPPAYLGEWLLVRFTNPTAGSTVNPDSGLWGHGIGVIVDDD